MAEHTAFHGETQVAAAAAGDAIDEYYNHPDQSFALNEVINQDEGYSALRWIIAKAMENATAAGPSSEKIAELVRRYDKTYSEIEALSSEEARGPVGDLYDTAVYDFAHNIAELLRGAVAISAGQKTVASLDGSVDAADWITEGHVLDAHEVAYLRSLVIPGKVEE
jgi:hypothetical protein